MPKRAEGDSKNQSTLQHGELLKNTGRQEVGRRYENAVWQIAQPTPSYATGSFCRGGKFQLLRIPALAACQTGCQWCEGCWQNNFFYSNLQNSIPKTSAGYRRSCMQQQPCADRLNASTHSVPRSVQTWQTVCFFFRQWQLKSHVKNIFTKAHARLHLAEPKQAELQSRFTKYWGEVWERTCAQPQLLPKSYKTWISCCCSLQPNLRGWSYRWDAAVGQNKPLQQVPTWDLYRSEPCSSQLPFTILMNYVGKNK